MGLTYTGTIRLLYIEGVPRPRNVIHMYTGSYFDIDPKLAKSRPTSDTNRNGFDFDRRRTVLSDVEQLIVGLV